MAKQAVPATLLVFLNRREREQPISPVPTLCVWLLLLFGHDIPAELPVVLDRSGKGPIVVFGNPERLKLLGADSNDAAIRSPFAIPQPHRVWLTYHGFSRECRAKRVLGRCKPKLVRPSEDNIDAGKNGRESRPRNLSDAPLENLPVEGDVPTIWETLATDGLARLVSRGERIPLPATSAHLT